MRRISQGLLYRSFESSLVKWQKLPANLAVASILETYECGSSRGTPLRSTSSLWTRDLEPKILPVLRELGIGFVACSPGRLFLTGEICSTDDFADDDARETNPRFVGENFQRNLRAVDEVKAIAVEAGATPAQTALA